MFQCIALMLILISLHHSASVRAACLGVSECHCELVPDNSGQQVTIESIDFTCTTASQFGRYAFGYSTPLIRGEDKAAQGVNLSQVPLQIAPPPNVK